MTDATPKRGNPNFRSLADEPTVRVMVSLPTSVRDWLRTQRGESDSERLRLLVMEWMLAELMARAVGEEVAPPSARPDAAVASQGDKVRRTLRRGLRGLLEDEG